MMIRTTAVRGGMEPFYGANQPYFSITPLIGWRNMRDVRAGVDGDAGEAT